MNIDLTRTNPKQLRFLTAEQRYVGYGGARGGGKSWAVRAKAVLLALRYPGIKLMIVRRSFEELRTNHIDILRQMCLGTAKYSEQRHELLFTNGSKIMFGYCDAERDVLRYQGQEYDCIFLDEATQLTEFQFQTFKGCLRGVNDFPKRIYLTCNPGGVGHAWVKRLFIDRDFRAGENGDDYVFIQAGVYDNLPLMEKDPEYVKGLESLPYELREAWLYGKWDVIAGQFFSEWEREIHVCAPFEIPTHWLRYVTMDYGMDMLAAYLIAVDETGNAYVIREVYEGRDLGEGHEGLIISEATRKIKELCEGEKIYTYLAPPDLWNARQETGRSVADIFAENDIYLTKTSNDRAAGWMAVHEMLKIVPDETGVKTARMKIFPRCVNLIRTLPLLQYDERRVNDVANEPHELTHAPDAIRGFCVYWISNAETPTEPRREKLIDQINRANKRRGRREQW